MKLFHLPVNLQTTLIHSNKPDTCNTILARYVDHTKTLTIRAGFQIMQKEIADYCIENVARTQKVLKVVYTSHFDLMGWGEILKSYTPQSQIEEVKERLVELRKLIGENIVGAWNASMSEPTDAVILGDIEQMSDDYDDKDPESEEFYNFEYNGWYEKLCEIQELLD